MKFIKYALFALGGLVILAGAVLAYVAATFDPNQYKPQIVQAVKDRTQRTLKLEGNIRLALWPSIGARIGKSSLSEHASDREFAAMEEVRVALKLLPLLTGQAVVDTVRIKGLRANIVKGRDGKTNLDDLTGPPPAKGAPAAKDAGGSVKLDIAGVELTDAALTYADAATGSKYVLSQVNLKTGRLTAGVPTGVEFSIHVQSDKPKIDLPVTLKTRLTFDPEKQSLALADLALDAKGTAAGQANFVVKLTGSADVDGAKEHARANLTGIIADSSVKARLDIAGFAKPVIGFELEADRLDVDRYMPAQAAGGKPAATGKQPEKEEPFDLSGLREVRANGTVKFGSLKVNNVQASNVRLELKANGGRMELSPVTATFYQGMLVSAILVDAAPAVPSFAVKHNMTGVSVGPFLKDLASNDMLEGKGNVILAVTTQGNTVTALKKALNGTADVRLTDGAVKGIDIGGSVRDAKAGLGALRGEQTQAADKNQKTDFSELTATFKIADGVARNNDLSLKSPLLRVGGEGEINIGADSLNYLVRASIVGTSKGQGGRETADLRGVTVPVRVSGPLAAPSYKLDFGSTVKDAAKEELKSRLLDRFGGGTPKDGAAPEEKKSGSSTRDALKGLFGR